VAVWAWWGGPCAATPSPSTYQYVLWWPGSGAQPNKWPSDPSVPTLARALCFCLRDNERARGAAACACSSSARRSKGRPQPGVGVDKDGPAAPRVPTRCSPPPPRSSAGATQPANPTTAGQPTLRAPHSTHDACRTAYVRCDGAT